MKTIRILLIALFVTPATTALAHDGSHPGDPNLHVDPSVKSCEVRFAPELTQEAFGRFTREFGSVSAFKQGGPPNTLGQWRVSVSVDQFSFQVEERSAAWNDTFTHPTSDHELGSQQNFPKLELRVGVTDDTDVGLYYTMNPQSNYGWIGIDVKHALLRQGPDMPVTLSVRGAYTKTLFVTDMDMHALSAGVSVSRTLWKTVTPYVGLGGDAVLARETASTVQLDTELAMVPSAFAGLQVAFWHLAVGVEAHFAAISSTQLQVSAVF